MHPSAPTQNAATAWRPDLAWVTPITSQVDPLHRAARPAWLTHSPLLSSGYAARRVGPPGLDGGPQTEVPPPHSSWFVWFICIGTNTHSHADAVYHVSDALPYSPRCSPNAIAISGWGISVSSSHFRTRDTEGMRFPCVDTSC